MKIQWYPGHMTKAKRAMSDAIKLVDIIIEMTDARAPEATRNPEIMGLGTGKSRIIILNKADLADENANIRWASYYKEQGYECMFMDSRQKNGVNSLIKAIENVSKEQTGKGDGCRNSECREVDSYQYRFRKSYGKDRE